MKYDASTPIGQDWAGYNGVRDSYDWDPATFVPGVANDVAGVEAPLWTDVFPTWDDVQFMAFPRLPGIAEIGWSAQRTHSWDDYRVRLAAQGPLADGWSAELGPQPADRPRLGLDQQPQEALAQPGAATAGSARSGPIA